MLPLVSEVTAGVSYQAAPRLLSAGEVSVHGWGRYKSLDIYLEDSNTGEMYGSHAEKNFIDRAVWKFGAEYQVGDLLAVRGGYYFEEFVSSEDNWCPETPDPSRHPINGVAE